MPKHNATYQDNANKTFFSYARDGMEMTFRSIGTRENVNRWQVQFDGVLDMSDPLVKQRGSIFTFAAFAAFKDWRESA